MTTQINIDHINQVRKRAKKLVTAEQVNTSLNTLAQKLHDLVSEKDPLFICVMHGGLVPMTQLITRLDFPLEVDYIHATRYGRETAGQTLKWLVRPTHNLRGRNIVVVDDIYDEGYTLAAAIDELQQQDPASLISTVLFNKVHNHKADFTPDLIGMDIPDFYIFGNGMDYKGYFRNLTDIYALSAEDME